jgi:hypothetical protein
MMNLQQQQQQSIQLQKALEKRQEIEREIQALYSGTSSGPFNNNTPASHHTRSNSNPIPAMMGTSAGVSPRSVARSLSITQMPGQHHQFTQQTQQTHLQAAQAIFMQQHGHQQAVNQQRFQQQDMHQQMQMHQHQFQQQQQRGGYLQLQAPPSFQQHQQQQQPFGREISPVGLTRQRQLTPPSPPQPYVPQQMFGTTQQMGVMDNGFSGLIYQVQFKRCMRDLVSGPLVTSVLSVGDFVVAECERGEDVGVVVEVLTMKAFVDRRYQAKVAHVDDEDSSVGRITRLATTLERQQLPEKFHDEQAVLQYATHLARSTFNLPMHVLDAEYQFDRLKLTIYYTSDMRIDFRELVRDLFSAFKTRIWMKKSNQSRVFAPKQFAVMQLSTGAQFSQF